MTNKDILIFDNINLTSPSNTLILENISFEIKSGEFISIVGPNGAGKTTLFKLILGLIRPSTGRILFPNFDRKKSIGYVPQVKTLDRKFPATVLELICSGITGTWNFIISKAMKNKAIEILKDINADYLAYRQLSRLSGGELQRVYLARAIISRPSLLLLDEPSSGIDFVCECELEKIIFRLNKDYGTTIMMITHDISSAYHHSNKVILLNKTIISYGNSTEVLTDDNLMLTFSNHNHSHSVKLGLKYDK